MPVRSVDDWLELCRQHRNAARILKQHKQPNMLWLHVGFSVECCLKAAIMKKERIDGFPTKQEDPGLWTHNLFELFRRLGIDPRTLASHSVAAPLKTVLEWKREHGYSPQKLPERRADDMYRAAFEANGVVEWLAHRYRMDI